MFDIAQLLVPVSMQQACGADLSFSSELDDIMRARVQDDPSLAQGEWVAALKDADWHFVAERCAVLIASRSKDLRLAVWLAEAHAKLHHFRGLGDGFALLASLCERYWDGLYPLPDECDGHEQRSGNLAWLLARTQQLVRHMPVSEDGAVAMADFDAARQRANAAAQGNGDPWRTPQQADAGPGLAELDAARRRNSMQFNRRLLEDVQYCSASLASLQTVVDAKLGAQGPAFGAAREAILNALDFIEPLVSGGAVDGERPAPDERAMSRSEAPSAGLQGRAQALAQLRSVADFFRRTEPHSPVAYLADKAAHWGDMPLHVWLRNVVKDPGALAQMEEMLGTGAPPE
ncbi:type VI secretion system protein TssA [Pseudoduganella ginsengisoli]|uniref:Type VI secretion system protein TssA n=1 Tax=Pseudoduganella ginsengisoli TaxID=1462440 RepID=A0A6L6PZC2_9BURK|nr:type VI secretion system protein TssA [Pseudoduganella ginsengisoli]MTW02112.1 type VI secretion system protein TssA [Pseudoduganella ginsengisoli]